MGLIKGKRTRRKKTVIQSKPFRLYGDAIYDNSEDDKINKFISEHLKKGHKVYSLDDDSGDWVLIAANKRPTQEDAEDTMWEDFDMSRVEELKGMI